MADQRPMVTVDQNMTTTPTSIERDQPAFIFGPNYVLHRYSDASEKPTVSIGAYEGEALTSGYPGALKPKMVDASYTKLFGDNVVVELCELADNPALPENHQDPNKLEKNGGYTMLLFEGKAYVGYDMYGVPVSLSDGLKRGLAAGDVLRVFYEMPGGTGSSDGIPTWIDTKVVKAEYSSNPWQLDEDSSSEGGAGTIVTISDAIPLDANITGVSLVDVLQGVEFTRKNLAEATTVDIWQWEQEWDEGDLKKTGIKVNTLYAIDYSYFDAIAPYGKVLSADLYVSYRELDDSYADSFHSITGSSEVYGVLGTVDPDNPLAMGVYMAALNAATDDGDETPPIYFMAVPTDDVEGYAAVLGRATLTDRAYVFAPTTQDEEVLELVRSHVLEMSSKISKMWRIAAASAKIPNEVQKLGATFNAQGHEYYAIPVSGENGVIPDHGPYSMFRVVTSGEDIEPNKDTSFRSTLVKGDKVRFYRPPYTNKWGEARYDEYTIEEVLNNHTFSIKAGLSGDLINVAGLPSTGISYVPQKIEVFHHLTSLQSAEMIASISKGMASRRMLNVFPPVFQSDGKTLTGEFAACAVAGLISATEPQQPITNVTVRGIDSIPMTYQEYNSSELDLIASGGTFIVAQDLPGDIVYVRHQITTAYPDGNLNTAELSITKNVDSISYAFADTFRPYYGKYNITPELIAILENLAGQLISQFAGSTSVYGPQLIAEQTSIKYVRQNAIMKDHVDVAITLGVPYPCNNIDIVLTV